MDKRAKEDRFNRVRGFILYFLVKAYPAYLSHYDIKCYLDDLRHTIDEEELEFHLAYLQERKFIRLERYERDGVKVDKVFSTADGILVVKGIIQDPAIDMEALP